MSRRLCVPVGLHDFVQHVSFLIAQMHSYANRLDAHVQITWRLTPRSKRIKGSIVNSTPPLRNPRSAFLNAV
jgi:hypothetical protein